MNWAEEEATEPQGLHRLPDPLSDAIGTSAYIRNHKIPAYIPAFPNLRLVVSRFYFQSDTMVDFKREAGEMVQIGAKQIYCQRHKLRYLLLEDMFDLSPFQVETPIGEVARMPTQYRAGQALKPRRR